MTRGRGAMQRFGSAVLLAGFLGCGGIEEAEVDQQVPQTAVKPEKKVPPPEAQQELYVASTKTWPSHTIHVCWMTGGYSSEKAWVKAAVVASWQRVANVTFDDWGTCPTNSLQPYWPYSGGLRIRVADENPRTSALGKDLSNLGEDMTLNFTFATWSQSYCAGSNRQSCIEAIAAHEFGHALGFAHEQNRPDTPASCTDAPQGANGDLLLGGWDLDSIMNYCNPDWNNEHLPGYLSEGDVSGVRQEYGTRGDAIGSPIALTLAAGETTIYGSNLKSTNDGPNPSGVICATSPNVWYQFTLSGTEVFYADTAGSNWDTALTLVNSSNQLVTGFSNDDANCAAAGDWLEPNGYESRISGVLNAGTYKLGVAGCGTHNFELHLQHLPESVGAYFEGQVSGTGSVSTFLVGASKLTSSCGGAASGEDVRWFQSCGGSSAFFSLCTSDGGGYSRAENGAVFDPVLYQWSPQTGAPLACNDDGGAAYVCTGTGGDASNYGSRLTFTSSRGLNGIVVDERSGGTPSGHGMDYTLAYSVP